MLGMLAVLLSGEVRYDDALNGSGAAPEYAGTVSAAPLTMTPAGGAADFAVAGGAVKSAPRAVLLAWLGLFALLVVAHVLTISVQR